MKNIIYYISKVVGGFIFRILYLPQVKGKENIPQSGSVILCGNHTNNLDACFMVCIPKRMVHTLAKKELFKSKISSWFFKSMACIPVDRKNHEDESKNEAIKILNNNEVLGIFPEGTTNKTNKLLEFKYGAVSFAKKTNAYIVPFSITGKYKIWRKSIKIKYGKPYKVVDSLEIENKKLMNIIDNMIKEEKNENN